MKPMALTGTAGCARKGIELSALTVHNYMNTELGLRSIVRQKAPRYQGGIEHKKYDERFSNPNAWQSTQQSTKEKQRSDSS